jgi:hypothetical protein
MIAAISPQIQRQQPVTFTDPFNRTWPLHLEFICSYDEFMNALKFKFEEAGCASAMLDQKEFVVEEEGTQRKIDMEMQWGCSFLPGQRVGMSMIFR